jgi:hypothetical protein
MTMDAKLESCFRAQQVSPLWAFVRPALAEVMAGSAGHAELKALFRRAGATMGEEAIEGLPEIETVSELESALNDFWLTRRWGQVAFGERKGYMEIVHHVAPLAEAFGEASLPWTCGILEGFYEAILHALGAGDDLAVVADSSDAGGLVMRFRFSR